MGQKVNPIGLRVGIIRSWESRWFSEKNYRQWLAEDIKLREFVKERFFGAGVSRGSSGRGDRQGRCGRR